MTSFPAVIAALLLSSRPDLSVARPPPAASLDPGPFRAGELAGAGAGVLAADALFLAAAWGTYHLFVDGHLAPTAGNFRGAGLSLAAVALLLPPFGATLGGHFARAGPTGGAAWKAFLLAFVANAGAIAAGLAAMPAVWVVVPVQLAALTAGTSLGLHWGGRGARAGPDAMASAAPPDGEAPAPARAPTAFELASRTCPDGGPGRAP